MVLNIADVCMRKESGKSGWTSGDIAHFLHKILNTTTIILGEDSSVRVDMLQTS